MFNARIDGTNDGKIYCYRKPPGRILKDCRVPFMCIDFKAKNRKPRVSHRPDVEPQLHALQVLVEVPAKGQGTNAARQICALHTSTFEASWKLLAAPQARLELGGAMGCHLRANVPMPSWRDELETNAQKIC